MFTLFAIVFFLLGLALFGIGLIGEYVGRTYEQVRGRPALSDRGGVGAQPAMESEHLRVLETTRV